jgi:hypothetical protein
MRLNNGVNSMAKKRASRMTSAHEKKSQMVRLELPMVDYKRLDHHAKALGLTKASYARMAVMERIRADESKEG